MKFPQKRKLSLRNMCGNVSKKSVGLKTNVVESKDALKVTNLCCLLLDSGAGL